MFKRIMMLVSLIVLSTSLVPMGTAATPAALAINKSMPFGLVTTLANRVREDELDSAVHLLQEAGVQWAREEIFWDRLQPERNGPYLWGGPGGGMYNYDAAIGKLNRAGINVLGLLDYNPAWYKGKNPPLDAWIQDWGDYVYNTVARYGRDRGQIKYWEVWNEENLRTFGYENGIYSVKEYVRVLEVARAAIKAADPSATVVLGGVAAIWSEITRDHDYDVLTYLQLLYDAGGWDDFDILAIHPYRPGPPEAATWRRDTALDVEAELQALDALIQKLGTKPIWLTEVGWSSYRGSDGVSLEDQAAFLVRMYLLALAHPTVERIFWYDFRDDTSPYALYHEPVFDEKEREYHFGLLRRSFPLDTRRADLRKPVFLAYRTMSEILGGMQLTNVAYAGTNPAAPGVFAYRYASPSRAAYVVWRISGSPSTISLPCGCTSAHIRRADGSLLTILHTDGTIQLRLDQLGTPVYVEWGADRSTNGPFFPSTGHHISPPFLGYWQQHGGLAQFGYPISGPMIEPAQGTGLPRLVQYFERNRLEYDALKRSMNSSDVQIGRLGDDFLRKKGIDWTTLPRQNEAPPECSFFAETSRRLCEPFKSYWEQNGGLAIYGLPLTEAADENGYLVQYFERARFEYHADKAGTPFAIQLGLLGRELFSRWGIWP